ncbi:hypothetical protein HPQ64_04270 [Rhizobiales bacterium]|uniref:hypothetical protein n=1 Tax=Hongsoonwoonella zoysiae TaxID=2821844 RepID=UPI00155F843F|nr:hypothetical protein [Hongsoonwoonella zoysiae]NRG16902.1 hypothetical protein [Hongsoonwoonella zoysiae]
MSPAEIKDALSEVITEIQTNSGLNCPILENSIVPANDIPSFDSKVWLVATTMLASKIETEIPDDENIFIGKESNKPMSLEEICEFVAKIIELKKAKSAAA